jgi:hypothetical protein
MIAESNDSGLAIGPGLEHQLLEQVTVTQMYSVKDPNGQNGVLARCGIGQ